MINYLSKRASKISLFFFFAAVLIGTLLRTSFFYKLPFEYGNLVHAHSHVAFQGWIYTIILLITTKLFLNKKQIQKGHYPLQFKLSIIVIIGILISFSAQGYGLYSIFFSSVFQLLNYWFIFSFLKDVKRSNNQTQNVISIKFIKTGLWLGVISGILPFGVGLLSAKGLNNTEIYYSFIYSFLHLQYNGWFLFVAIGVFFKCLEKDKILHHQKHALKFYWLFTITVIPALSLSFLGMSFSRSVILLAGFSAILQIMGTVFFFLLLKPMLLKWLHKKNIWFQVFIKIFLLSFFLKIILQFLSIIPVFEQFAFANKNIILAYLHLNFIGVLSSLFLAILIELNWIHLNSYSKTGIVLLLSGFISTELMLVFSGIDTYYNQQILLIGSIGITFGVLLLLIIPKTLKTDLQNLSNK